MVKHAIVWSAMSTRNACLHWLRHPFHNTFRADQCVIHPMMCYELTKMHASRADKNTCFMLMLKTRCEPQTAIHSQTKEQDKRRNDIKKFNCESHVALTTAPTSIKGQTSNDSECFISANESSCSSRVRIILLFSFVSQILFNILTFTLMPVTWLK